MQRQCKYSRKGCACNRFISSVMTHAGFSRTLIFRHVIKRYSSSGSFPDSCERAPLPPCSPAHFVRGAFEILTRTSQIHKVRAGFKYAPTRVQICAFVKAKKLKYTSVISALLRTRCLQLLSVYGLWHTLSLFLWDADLFLSACIREDYPTYSQ